MATYDIGSPNYHKNSANITKHANLTLTEVVTYPPNNFHLSA